MKKILAVIGTRPEAIKMAPVINRLKERNDLELTLCSTGQHKEMLDQILKLYGMVPDYDLNIMEKCRSLTDITTYTMNGLEEIYNEKNFDITIVHGDTTTALAAALGAFYNGSKVFHVEAGLRTRNLYSPWPEELNRQIIGRIATIHFAPTERAKVELMLEGVEDGKIFVTGNTVIDSLSYVSGLIALQPEKYKKAIFDPSFKTKILVTGHRRENLGGGFESICKSLKFLADQHKDMQIVYPVHMNPNVRNAVYSIIGETDNIRLVEPLGYIEFVNAMMECSLILTDSGGVQEEAPAFGKPVLVMRNNTERQEAIDAGVAILVGTSFESITHAVNELICDNDKYNAMAYATSPFGDGTAAVLIEKIICDYIKNEKN